jgi:hypothetical protein
MLALDKNDPFYNLKHIVVYRPLVDVKAHPQHIKPVGDTRVMPAGVVQLQVAFIGTFSNDNPRFEELHKAAVAFRELFEAAEKEN